MPLVDELAVWAFRATVQGVKYNFNAYPVLSDATLRNSASRWPARVLTYVAPADPRRGPGAVRGHAGRLQHAVPGARRPGQDDARRVRHQPRPGRPDARPAPPRRAGPRAVRPLRRPTPLRGDLGTSIRSRRPVATEIGENIGSTGQLALAAMVVAVGARRAARPARRARRATRGSTSASMVVALLGVSMPSFWLGLLLIFVFSLHLGWFPATGGGDLAHLVLPARDARDDRGRRSSRGSPARACSRCWARTTCAPRGPRASAGASVVVRHALKNALIPVITVFGLQFGNLLAGAVIVETVFSRPGLGRLIVGGILAKDFPLVQGTVLFVATALRADQRAGRRRLCLRRPADPDRLSRARPAWRAGSRAARRVVGARDPGRARADGAWRRRGSAARDPDPDRARARPCSRRGRASCSAAISSAATWRAGCSTAPASR